MWYRIKTVNAVQRSHFFSYFSSIISFLLYIMHSTKARAKHSELEYYCATHPLKKGKNRNKNKTEQKKQ